MRSIAIVSQKGGTGKTTLATHLAVIAANAGTSVLIDLDPQCSTADWWGRRYRALDDPLQANPLLSALPPSKLLEKKDQFARAGLDTLIVDTAPDHEHLDGINAAIAVADIILVPTRPSSVDLRAIRHTLDLLKRQTTPYFVVVNQAQPHTQMATAAVEQLHKSCPTLNAQVRLLTEFQVAMSEGKTATETSPKGQAANDIIGLWAEILTRLHNTPERLSA